MGRAAARVEQQRGDRGVGQGGSEARQPPLGGGLLLERRQIGVPYRFMLSLTIEAVSGELHQLLNEMAGFKRTPAARASSLVPGFPRRSWWGYIPPPKAGPLVASGGAPNDGEGHRQSPTTPA